MLYKDAIGELVLCYQTTGIRVEAQNLGG